MALMDDLSLIIKTFERQSALERLLSSIRAQGYADCPVLVADDSKTPYKDAILQEYGDVVTDYVVLPFDVGKSKGVNELLEMVQTPYFILNDDDFVYDYRTNLSWMVDHLRSEDLDILGGVVYEKERIVPHGRTLFSRIERKARHLLDKYEEQEITRRCRINFERSGSTLELQRSEYVSPLSECDYTLSFFAARTNIIRDKLGGFDESLKISEHWEFFYRAKLKGLRTAETEEVGALHFPQRDPTYNRFRKRRSFRRLGMLKHGIKRIVDLS